MLLASNSSHFANQNQICCRMITYAHSLVNFFYSSGGNLSQSLGRKMFIVFRFVLIKYIVLQQTLFDVPYNEHSCTCTTY